MHDVRKRTVNASQIFPENLPWQPLSVQEINGIFAAAPFKWWIAGGYAIEEFVGKPFRAHGDIDILVLKRDAAGVRPMLAGWDLWMADPPGQLRPWAPDAGLPAQVSDVWCRRQGDKVWRFQLMFDESLDADWVSRRCPTVSLPLDAIGWRNRDRIPFLKPEIQLFYKAKAPREKDTVDLQHCLKLLDIEQTKWLAVSIRAAYGEDAVWLHKIDEKLP